MSFFKDLFGGSDSKEKPPELSSEARLDTEIAAIFRMLADTMGTERLVIQAGKMNAMTLMRSEDRRERVLALMRILEEDPLLTPPPSEVEIPDILARMTEQVAGILARRNLEDRIERKVNEKLEKDHEEYVEDIRRQVISEENPGAESPHDKKKREDLEALEDIHLSQSVMELLRPKNFGEIVGQERAVASLLAKLSSPYPQHLLLYGPPGIGKTTAARLVLEAAKKRAVSPFAENAPFVETDGTTLRWDPRDMTNPLLGSVHDPIYQGAQKSLADSGVPEPKPGLVTDAHGGILFIDEIGEMDEMLQNKLLKVLEDKRAYFESAYYDPDDKRVPPYIRKLFEEGAPADFVLIGATTRNADHINPALRSRCAEIYFEPLTPGHILTIVENAAQRLHVHLAEGVAQLISEYTIEGRKAINILADAYSLALNRLSDSEIERIVSRETLDGEADPSAAEFQGVVSRETKAPPLLVTKDDIYEVAQVSRLYPYGRKKASDTPAVGRVFGLGVSGFLGSIIEIEAVSFPASEKGKGTVRFNETAGSMAKDSVFNAASVMRQLTGRDIHDYDIHVNVIGGGNIDGPSAGTAILAAIVSAVTGAAIRQNVAVTGEISLQGEIEPVGGVFEKGYGARQAGIGELIIPWENKKDIPEEHLGLTIHCLKTAEEAFAVLFADEKWKQKGESNVGRAHSTAEH
ncbi:ATP-dependent protease, Lon family [Selenomonas sp. oral taxon 892 str. F0426]|uniref:S16 family serine protease n=1 Tax=Selenomonas sp. oral taxon 892 TaxID=1321785 RepID=UPI0003AD306A|nr:S16 family serine protease [Selenomonas sp. oral taxon 892]ERJ91910.1 ATP-dependent protease, Lon family [Selenomonas sp. oral taxon 892 str. F0426]